MADATPVRLSGVTALRWAWRLARDPLVTTRHCLDAFGPFVMLTEVLPFTPPFIRSARPVLLRVPLVLSAGATFHRELLSDPATWRGVSLLPGGPKNSAARRMSLGLTRMTGDAHAHYRRLLVAPLRKASVDALAAGMARLAEVEAASWPVGKIIDLWEHTRRLMQRLAVELLFGDTSGQGNLIADRVSRLMAAKWGLRPFAPINLPITSYGRMLREAELLERDLLEWAWNKRGSLDGRDLASIIVNSPDADGCPLDDAAIAGQMPSLFAAVSEASQTVLTWTLLLLVLHPRVARELLDELRNELGAVPSLDSVGDLPYLDAVVKESMRIIPPVPMQMRVAQRDTTIAGHSMPNGTRVILNTFLTNRMRDLYPEGDVFRPERWFTITPSAFEFPVFSGGPYSCPGYWFGLTSVKIALAAILTRYRMTLTRARVDYRVQPTMRPLQSLRVLLHRQDGAFAATPVTGKIRNLISLPH